MVVVGAIIGLAVGLLGMNYRGPGSKLLELLAPVAFIYVVVDTRLQRRRPRRPSSP
jgi:hypothetical protein